MGEVVLQFVVGVFVFDFGKRDMGYDFAIMRIRPTAPTFPYEAGLGFAPLPFDSVEVVEEVLLAFRGARRSFGVIALRWEGPRDETIDVYIGKTGVMLDTHAKWGRVLEVYSALRDWFPDVYIMDKQTAKVYDRVSFVRFMEEHGQE